MTPRSDHVVTNGRIFLKAKNYYILHAYQIFFVFSPNSRHLDGYCIMGILNNAIMNMGMQVSLQNNDLIALEFISRYGTIG
jgi:hypothetical protein